ncbi:aspartate carbamoyltransferase catalytic subunit [Brevibacillus fulvus]|uniref:Aspartate carbamoyltransferase n=1 Tax=Brevibacillus fulvus TaxID=1125967 RepID=A0A938XS60_9BACL|nr:aspartate carbamoyltransferase catalytic subunit [Brevibacillus fulvus]MBM7589358.1 aspartate carbamoyltransferase catalytic subunit [Brevibacillus fulvus]
MNCLNHLISMNDLSTEQIKQLIKRADDWATQPATIRQPLAGSFVANLFLEPSTRTRFSFEMAEKRLGAQVLNFAAESSSTSKGESIYDTLRTLQAMGVQAAVIRTKQNHLLQQLRDSLQLQLINAGDGTNEHPTQCLLDLLTIWQHFGRFAGLRVAIIGDLRHSRVLGSHLQALPRLGVELLLAGPQSMMRDAAELPSGVKIVDMAEAVQTSDVVMMLRVQLERHSETLLVTKEEYHEQFGLTLERAKSMKPGAVIMHPGPFNRGVEIASELVEADNSLIFKQVENGVAARMAVLESLLTGGKAQWESSLQTVNL